MSDNKKTSLNQLNKLKKEQKKIITEKLKQHNDIGLKNGVFFFTNDLSVNEFSQSIKKPLAVILQFFFNKEIILKPNDLLNEDQIGELCLELGYNFQKEVKITPENLIDELHLASHKKDLQPRHPIVTIMGHVDHGKTTLLEKYRHINILQTEHGGITQHMGAYTVQVENDKFITFIDTPGHAVFTEMRARGSAITDIVVLVVAADDGVMPQTKEAISHAQAAKVPIIVFINKMDKPNADIDKVLVGLSQEGITAEKWGGSTIIVQGSALKEQGLTELLSAILLIADLQELKANPNQLATGIVLEGELDAHKGSLATVVVLNGTLHLHDMVVAGGSYGRARAMFNDLNQKIDIAIPSVPVQIQGLNKVPNAGDRFIVIADEKLAREIANAHRSPASYELNPNINKKFTLDDFAQMMEAGQDNKLNLILKGDTKGTLEALTSAINKININELTIKILYKGVGAISEADITLAVASQAIVVGFNVASSIMARKKAESNRIEIRIYNVIYKVIDDITAVAKALLPKKFESKITGHLDVRKLFVHSKIGTIAGCRVMDGLIKRNSKINLIRDKKVIYTGNVNSLKFEKNNIKESRAGQECGVVLNNHNDIIVGDMIESFDQVEIKPE